MKSKSKIKKKIPTTIDDFLATKSDDQRIALEKLRTAIRAAAPNAEECISYQIPTFRLDGKMLVSFASWKDHCAFYPGSLPISVHRKELKSYDLDKGTVRFSAKRPLSLAL